MIKLNGFFKDFFLEGTMIRECVLLEVNCHIVNYVHRGQLGGVIRKCFKIWLTLYF